MANTPQTELADAARFRAALRRFLRQSEDITRQHGLPPRHYELLLMIRAEPEQRATVGHLVEHLQLTQSTVTELVQRAETAGLLQRRVSQEDARSAYLSLTDEGERRLSASVNALGPERAKLLSLLAETVRDP